MKSDFEADVLTPQLLKPAVTTGMADYLDAINAFLKSSAEAKKAETALKNWNAKNNKKAGGGGGGGGKKQQQPKKK
jgi:hypothetical protein